MLFHFNTNVPTYVISYFLSRFKLFKIKRSNKILYVVTFNVSAIVHGRKKNASFECTYTCTYKYITSLHRYEMMLMISFVRKHTNHNETCFSEMQDFYDHRGSFNKLVFTFYDIIY
jgi:hypothetical protein